MKIVTNIPNNVKYISFIHKVFEEYGPIIINIKDNYFTIEYKNIEDGILAYKLLNNNCITWKNISIRLHLIKLDEEGDVIMENQVYSPIKGNLIVI